MKKIVIMMILSMLFSSLAFGRQFYASDFEKDTIGKAPQGWEIGFEGNGEATVIEDPVNNGNQVFAHTDLPQDQARHDVGGVIWVVGEEDWTDYIVEYDAYFPTDFYIGTLFRYQDDEAFYLFDRRQGGPTFDFWMRKGGGWTNLAAGAAFAALPEDWFRFRLEIEGDTFRAYAKEADDNTPFTDIDPLLEGSDGSFASGKFGLYGLIYIDNIIIGEADEDMVFAVEPEEKLAITWGQIK